MTLWCPVWGGVGALSDVSRVLFLHHICDNLENIQPFHTHQLMTAKLWLQETY